MAKIQKIVTTWCLIKNWKVLLIQRSMNEKFFPWKYEMPWWKIDFWEQPVDALKREYKEETNLNIDVWNVFYTFAYVSNNWERHTVEIIYFVNIKDWNDNIVLSKKDHIDYKRVWENELWKYFDDENDPIFLAIKKWFIYRNII